MYRLSIIFFAFTIAFSSCKKDYTNKKTYDIKVGEAFELYIDENSCCRNCWLNQNSLKSIQLVEKKLVESPPEDCIGCTSYYAYIFKGVAAGKDTISIANISPTINCEDLKPGTFENANRYIVTVAN